MPNRSYEFTEAGKASHQKIDELYNISLSADDRAKLSALTRDWVDAVFTHAIEQSRSIVERDMINFITTLIALDSPENYEHIIEKHPILSTKLDNYLERTVTKRSTSRRPFSEVRASGHAMRKAAMVGAGATAYVGSDVADSLFRWYWITRLLEGCSGGDHSSSDNLGVLALGVLVVTALLVALMFVVVLSSANVESLYYILTNAEDSPGLRCLKSVLQVGVVAGFIVPLSMWVVSIFNQAQAIASAATSKMWLMVLSVAGVVLVGLGLGAGVGYLIRTWHPTGDFNRRKAEFNDSKAQLAKLMVKCVNNHTLSDVRHAQETLERLLTGGFFFGKRMAIQGYVCALFTILINSSDYTNKPRVSESNSTEATVSSVNSPTVKPTKSYTPWLIGTVASSGGLALAAATYVWYSSSIPALAQIGTVPHILAITIAALGVTSMLVSVVMLVITLRDNKRFFDAQANKDPVVMGEPVASGSLLEARVVLVAVQPTTVPMGPVDSQVAQDDLYPKVV